MRSCFSTLYRVDAIEANDCVIIGRIASGVSVPSIGSMLLKPRSESGRLSGARLFQYPLSGRCY